MDIVFSGCAKPFSSVIIVIESYSSKRANLALYKYFSTLGQSAYVFSGFIKKKNLFARRGIVNALYYWIIIITKTKMYNILDDNIIGIV
jgi:hypothetical protein